MKLPEADEAKRLSTGQGLIEFLTHAVMEEREQCALIAEAVGSRHPNFLEVCQRVAAAIRARP